MQVIRRRWLAQATTVGRVVTIPLTAAAFYALHEWGGIADIPLWALYLILGLAGLTSFLAERRWPADCTRVQLHARVAIDIAATTVVIYAIGWGPTLAIGYVFVVANEFRDHGSRVWQPALVWTAIGIGLGEGAIAIGLAPTKVAEPAVHGLAVLAILGTAFIMRLLGSTTKLKEDAEAQVRSSGERFRSLVKNASDAICVADADGRVVTLTPAIEHITGYPPEEYIGKVHDRDEKMNGAVLKHEMQDALLSRSGRDDRCPNCGSPRIRFLGGGTERVEREVRDRLPGVRVGVSTQALFVATR